MRIIFTLIALPIAAFLAELFLPSLNLITGRNLILNITGNWLYFSGIFLLTVLTGFLSGIYPAFFISKMKPTTIITKGKIHTDIKGFTLRNGLVVFQFAVSVFLISSTLIINDQMQ